MEAIGEGSWRRSRTRTRRWKVSLPALLAMYLLAAMRAASMDSLDSCSFSQLQPPTSSAHQVHHRPWRSEYELANLSSKS